MKRRAWRLGVDVRNDSSWWDDDFEENIEAGMRPEELELLTRHWLSEEGKARLTFLIAEAEIKREDARIERRNKHLSFYSQIITWIFGLLGFLMGFYALWKK